MSATVLFPDRYVIEASESELGLVMIDTSGGLTVSDGVLGVDVATTSGLGTVRPDGTTITIDQDGTIHGADATQVATTSNAGKVKPDGTTITIDQDGTIHGASGSRSDWEQNDPAGNGYIANRPFYHIYEATSLLDSYHLGTVEYEPYREPSSETYNNITLSTGLIVGETYTVTMSDINGIYNGTSSIECVESSGSPTLDGYVSGNRVRVACTQQDSNTVVKVVLYTCYRTQMVARYGNADISIGLNVDELVKLPSKFVDVDNDTIKVNQNGQLYADAVTKVDDSTIKINSNGELYVALQNAASVGF